MKIAQINTNDVIQSWGNSYSGIIDKLLNSLGMEGTTLHLFKMVIISISLAVFCFIADFIARKIILVIIERIIKKTKNTWDDVLIEKKVFKHVAHIVPAVLIGVLAPVLYEGHPDWILALEKISEIYLTVAFILTIVAFFKAFQFYLESRPFLKGKPLDSYMQLIRLIGPG